MSTILFAWELGGGMGHLAPHGELIETLVKRGHVVHVAARDVGRAGVVLQGLPIHYWPVPLTFSSPKNAFRPTLSMAHILHNVGFATVADVTMKIAAWRNLFSVTRPDVLLADFSPTALLAARGSSLKSIAVAAGFCLPPNKTPLPPFFTLEHLSSKQQLIDDESQVTSIVNTSLQKHGLPVITCLAEIFHDTDAQWLTTIPELDHYPDRGAAEYFGFQAERPRTKLELPTSSGHRIFAYLKPFSSIEILLESLNRLKIPTIIACDGLSETLRQTHTSSTLTFVEADVDLNHAAAEFTHGITNGNTTSSARFLLAGKPILMIPLHLEQEIFAHAVTQQKLGLTVRPHESDHMDTRLRDFLNSHEYLKAAEQLAAKYVSGTPNCVQKMVDIIEQK